MNTNFAQTHILTTDGNAAQRRQMVLCGGWRNRLADVVAKRFSGVEIGLSLFWARGGGDGDWVRIYNALRESERVRQRRENETSFGQSENNSAPGTSAAENDSGSGLFIFLDPPI